MGEAKKPTWMFTSGIQSFITALKEIGADFVITSSNVDKSPQIPRPPNSLDQFLEKRKIKPQDKSSIKQ